MTQIKYTVDKSCSQHPLIRAPIPKQGRHGNIRLGPKRLFSLATLSRLDPKAGRDTYEKTKHLWNNLHGLLNVYLRFERNDIIAITSSEDLTEVSELVGIACGVAVLLKETSVNINRFTRFRPLGSSKRMDFQFIHAGQCYFHETKGITYDTQVNIYKNKIKDQKTATKKYCHQGRQRPPLAGATGTVTLYQHVDRKAFSSHVDLLDPPVFTKGYRLSRNEELARLLEYYLKFYAITHMRIRNKEIFDMHKWVRRIIQSLDSGNGPPMQKPDRFRDSDRGVDPDGEYNDYGGTTFDARISRAAKARFKHFDDALQSIQDPITFVGVSKNVTNMICNCDWDGLLSFSDPQSTHEYDSPNVEILDSGIIIKSVERTPLRDEEARAQFNQMHTQ